MYSIVCLFVLVQVLLQVQQRLSSYQCLPRDRCRPRLHRPVLVRFTLFLPLMLTAFRLPLRQQAKLPRLFPSFLFFNRYSSNNLLWVLNDFLCSPSAKVSASVTLGSEFSWDGHASLIVRPAGYIGVDGLPSLWIGLGATCAKD
jgi:hypothetical protein